ncbi:hypothetical protein HZS_6513 [Henneguya salminicola]|nr:hypothetical protein HZS_6513 [Henneguya salminicola]
MQLTNQSIKSIFLSDFDVNIVKDLQQKSARDNFEFDSIINNISKQIYRLNILDNRYKDIFNSSKKLMPNTLNGCKFILSESMKSCSLVDYVPTVTFVKKDNEFDYQNSDAMKISKLLSKKDVEITAREIAENIAKNIPYNELIQILDISNTGFINIKLKTIYVTSICRDIIIHGVNPPHLKSQRVIVDFSSPNIAKEMHVGHLRSTIIGESICRIFEFVGFDVLRVSHTGDWGTQFGMLIAHLEDKYPDYDKETPPISDLQQFYKESKKRFDDDEVFKKRARLKVVSLQTGTDEKVKKAWESICEISRRDFQLIYSQLNISVTERGESFYQSRMVRLVKELTTAGKINIEDECRVVHVPGLKVPLMLIKSDGGFTYDTSDLATLQYRLCEEKADWIIYVVDIGQRDHFEALFRFARNMNWYNPTNSRVEHVGFGLVLGEGRKKLKTRSGETVKLRELLDEGISRSKAKLLEKGLNARFSEEELNIISEAVGYSCIKYADLCHNLVSDYEFSFDRMLDDRGNTAVYLMYAYSRIRSIIRKTGVEETEIISYANTHGIQCNHQNELKLMRKLVHFPEIIFRIIFETYPHYLCEYLYELACIITDYYGSCQIIDLATKNPDMNRLGQIYASSLVLKKGFDLLGITALERILVSFRII